MHIPGESVGMARMDPSHVAETYVRAEAVAQRDPQMGSVGRVRDSCSEGHRFKPQ